jgi:hypothetical protein
MRIIAAAFVCFWLLAVLPAFAQGTRTQPGVDRDARPDHSDRDVGEPIAVSAKPTFGPRAAARPAHRFFDGKNSLALVSVAASLAGDGWSTQRALALPGAREVNPMARPFVSSRAGEIAYSGAGFALFTGGMYLAHRTRHHKLERIAPFALAGWESFLTAWNLHQVSRAPR